MFRLVGRKKTLKKYLASFLPIILLFKTLIAIEPARGLSTAETTSAESRAITFSSSKYLRASPGIDLGTLDFTIEMTFKFQSNSWILGPTSLGCQTSVNGGMFLKINSNSLTFGAYCIGYETINLPATMTAGTWHNLVIQRKSGLVGIWLDGVASSRNNSAGLTSFKNRIMAIGYCVDSDCGNGSVNSFTGSLSDLRIDKGIANYPNLTSPITHASIPYASSANTQFLLDNSVVGGDGSLNQTMTNTVAPVIALSAASESSQAGSAITGYKIYSTGGVITSYSISPSVAGSGLTFNASTGLLSGTLANDFANTTYTITASNGYSPASSSTYTINYLPPAVPTATTNAASAVTSTSATLNGSINANGASTAISFCFASSNAVNGSGALTSCTSNPTASVTTTSGAASVTGSVTGLSAGTTYYYQVIGSNSLGTTYGSVQSFQTLSPPTFTSLTPTSGSTAGGTSVTITGTNLSNATSVTIGGTTATVTSNTSTQIVVTAPSGTAGAKDVVITTAGGTVTGTGSFTYVIPTPTYTSLTPTSGPIAGGTSVTITGTNLSSATSVTIGGSAATITSNTSTQIVVTSPSGTAGAKDVVVTTAGGSATGSGAFTLVSAPTYSSLSPSSGTSSGGTSVTIAGTNLSNPTSVTIGGAAATIISNNSTQIVVTAPAGTIGAKDVVITTAGGTATGTGAFTYSGINWTKIYETTQPYRNSNTSYAYTTGYGLGASDAAQTLITAGRIFNKVRYVMTATRDGVEYSVDVYFDKWSTRTNPSSVDSTIDKLAIPTFGNAVQTNVSNCVIASDWPGVTNLSSAVTTGSGKTCRLELWFDNYSPGSSALSPAGPSNYDSNDTRAGNANYGSFQVHNVTAGEIQTILAWNRHYDTNPDLGFGNRSRGTSDLDWTFAQNTLGLSNWKLQIFIDNAATAPSAPTIGTASITSATTVSIPFTAGAANGSAITSYTVTSSPSIPLTNSGTTSPMSVTGSFVKGQAYTFTIAATNEIGTGSASSASNSITPFPATVPAAPTIGTVSAPNTTTISVPYTAGSSNGSTITGYTVTSSPSITLTLTSLATANPLTYTGTFIQGQAYTFSMTATNGVGPSSSSSASNSITPFNNYTITFDANGASGGTTASVVYGVNALLSAPSLSRTDYDFEGWSESSSGVVLASWNVVGTKTLYAIWTPAFVVTFVSAGTAVDPLTFTGTALVKPTDPSRTGYSFAGWKNPSNTTITWSYTPTASITLTAQWTINTFIITITQTSNGSISPTSATVDYGSNQLFTFTPVTGYSVASITIDGTALTSSALSTAISSGYSFTNVTAIHSITATYSLNSYTITFDANGATGGTTASVAYGTNALLSAPNLSRTDYSLAGWSESSSGALVSSWSVVGTKTLYAIWTPAFVVSFVSAGSAVDPLTYTGSALAKPTDPSRTGYSFAGWKNPSNTTITWSYTPTASITLTAQWTINTYIITITQTSNGSISPTSATVDYGSNQLFTFTPATGYSVASITVDGSALSSAALATAVASGYTFTNVTAIHTITATYALTNFTITFDANGATGGTTASVAYGSNALSSAPSLSRTDYTPAGWSETPTGTVITSWNVVGAKSLYAIWIPAFVVTFVSAGTAVAPVTYTTTALAKPTDPTRTGYSFTTWKDASNNAISWPFTPTASITLTAGWAINTYIITITQTSNGAISPTSATVDYGSNQLFTFTPATGFFVASITVDGSALSTTALATAITSGYTFTNVTAIHSITATYAAIVYRVTLESPRATVTQEVIDYTVGSIGIALPYRVKANYVFLGWYSQAVGGTLIGITGERYIPTASVTLHSHWIQETLYGIDPAKLTFAGDIRASTTQTRTLLAETNSSSVSVRVPAGALPEGTFVEVYSLSTDEYARTLVGAQGSYIVNLVVAWHTADELVPVATTPIIMTIKNATIKKGADVYAVQGKVVKKLATATVDGEVVVLISEDPIITVTNPVEAVTNPPAPETAPVAATGGGGGGGGPKLSAIYFQLVDPFDPTKIYTKPACVDIYSRTLIPQFMGTACSSNDGRINILVADAKISVRVYELGNGSVYREYVGVVENDVISIDDSKYFGSTTRWIINVSPNQSITSPQGDIKNVEDAQTQADRIIAEAKKQALQILETARNEIKTLTEAESTKILEAATTRATKILDDANTQAEKLLAEIKAAAAAAAKPAVKPTPTPTPTTPVTKPTLTPTTPTKIVPKVVTISCKKGNLVKNVSGTAPKCPTGYAQINSTTAKPVSKMLTITCVKGALSRKVTGTKPVCPAGFRKKN